MPVAASTAKRMPSRSLTNAPRIAKAVSPSVIASVRNRSDRRHVRATRFHQHLDAVAAGQAQVQQDQVRRAVADGVQGGASVAQPRHGVAQPLQRTLDGGAELRVVFDQKDVHEPLAPVAAPTGAIMREAAYE